MFKTLLSVISFASIAACGTAPIAASTTGQMTANFDRKGVKIEWSCDKTEKSCKNPQINAIEATGYAPLGCTRRTPTCEDIAFKLADMNAKAAFSRFLNEDIKTNSVTKTLTTNLAKTASNTTSETVEVRESDVLNGQSSDITTTDTVTTLVTTITSQSEMIIRGAVTKDERLHNSTAYVTVRWDAASSSGTQLIYNKHFTKK